MNKKDVLKEEFSGTEEELPKPLFQLPPFSPDRQGFQQIPQYKLSESLFFNNNGLF